jgi:hypothetical protein
MTRGRTFAVLPLLVLALTWATLGAANGTATRSGGNSVQQDRAVVSSRGTGHVIVYGSTPPTIRSVADARRATPGASRRFQRFVGRLGAKAVRQSPGSCSAYAGTWVRAYHTRGYAWGGYAPGCDGGIDVWRHTASGWHTFIGPTQEAFHCRRLRAGGVPSALFKPNGTDCITKDGSMIRYHHA